MKAQVLCDAPAVALAGLDALASSAQLHRIGGNDVQVYYRLNLYLSDKKKKPTFWAGQLPDAIGYAAAIKAEQAENRGSVSARSTSLICAWTTEPLPHGRSAHTGSSPAPPAAAILGTAARHLGT